MSRTAFVFANGDFTANDAALLRAPGADDLVICIDGGLRHCLAMGWVPDMLLGDFDSVEPEWLEKALQQGARRKSYPADKAASDLQLGLQYCATASVDQVVVMGISGGRTDHMLFNWLLPARQAWPFFLRLLDTHTDARVIRAGYPVSLPLAPATQVSLLALSETVQGVHTQGLRYALVDASLDLGDTLGLSNEVVGCVPVEVRIRTGCLLLLVNRF